MRKLHFIPFIFIVFVSCTGKDKEPATKSVLTGKHVNWEIGDNSNSNKIVEWYKLWDENKAFTPTDYFADTLWLNLPEEGKEVVVPNDQIAKRLKENRDLYQATSNTILSSVSLHDKISGEDWVMITTYSKWTESNGQKDSVLYHDDWRLVNGKINMLISFSKTPPKGFLDKSGK